jgi:hypothetical protein
MKILESRIFGNGYVRFGGGLGEKDCTNSTSPVAYPTVWPVKRVTRPKAAKILPYSSRRNQTS